MNDRLAPERLAPNQFASGKNIETRYGGVRSRRGSWRVEEPLLDDAGDDVTITGSMVFRSPGVGSSDTVVYSAHFPDQDFTSIYRTSFPLREIRERIPTPYPMEGKISIRFVQAYGYLYAFPDNGDPIRWDGEVGSEFEYVPNGTSGAIPQARDGVYAFNRLWLIEGDDTIIASDLLSANWDRINNEFRVEQGDGEKLVALRPFSNGNLIAFKERGIAVITGANNFTTTSDMTMQFIDDRVGCVSPDTAVAVGKDIFFLGREGVWTIQQTSEQNAQLVELPLSEPIWGLIQEINWQYSENFSAVNHDNYYICAVSVGGSEYPNRLIAYDLTSRSWVGYWELGATPVEIQRLDSIDHSSKQYLLGLQSNAATNALLEGDCEDFLGGFVDYFSTTPTGSAEIKSTGLGLSEHTTGIIRVRFKPDFFGTQRLLRARGSGNGHISLEVTREDQPGAKWPGDKYWQVEFQAGFSMPSGTYDADFPETYAGTNLGGYTDEDWYVLEIEGRADGKVYATLNGIGPREMVGTGYTGDWLSSGEEDIIIWGDNCLVDYVSIYTSEAVVSDPWYIYWGMNEVTDTTTTRYDVASDGTVTETTETVRLASDQTTPSSGALGSIAATNANITSELKTRGYTHGGELIQKSAYRGEVRFEHGQPSVTAVMGSDKPFDTETLASLNAKTYSLTAYDIHNKTAWVQDNSNDDFATPFREDYAPIALNGAGSGVDIGTNGLDLDVYAEHTELFTSLAVAGWVQFTLTNTQGYVRYNNLQIEADNRKLQQDGGNQ